MAIVALKIKVMPESPETDLKIIKEQAEKSLIEEGAKRVIIEEQDIAFGLKAIIVTIAWPEEKNTDIAENKLKEITGVSSTEIIDYRRAIG
ncbi:MAG: elongation factor 1-beta [Candidatus Pacearchaeota archaeon]